jgi:hypothetical protein
MRPLIPCFWPPCVPIINRKGHRLQRKQI